jgi:hypothetical protein
MKPGGTTTVARRGAFGPNPIVLSDEARFALMAHALRGLRVAEEEVARGGKGKQGFLDAIHLLAEIIDSHLVRTGRAWPLPLDPDRLYTLRCVFAWAAKATKVPSLRLELRRFARRVGVTR